MSVALCIAIAWTTGTVGTLLGYIVGRGLRVANDG